VHSSITISLPHEDAPSLPQTGSSGQVPVPPEKRFLINLSTMCLLSITLLAPLCADAVVVRWGFGFQYDSGQNPTIANTSLKLAHTIFPTQSLAIARVGIRAGTVRTGSPVYRLGIQSNGTNDFPNGTWVGGATNYGTTDMPITADWNWVDLPATANLAVNTRYHIVFEAQSADAANYASYVSMAQSTPAPYRPENGIYDELVGREYYSGTFWTRGQALPIVALDTNAVLGIGQPYFMNQYQTAKGTTRVGEVFTLTVPAPTGRHTLKAMGMRVLASKPPSYVFPEDDCTIHLQRVSDNAVLASQVLISKTALGDTTNAYVTIMTNLNTEVTLSDGEQYRIFICSPGCITGYYRSGAPVPAWSNTIPSTASAQFQGGGAYAAYSNNGTTWSQFFYNSMEADSFFLLDLEPILICGTVIGVR